MSTFGMVLTDSAGNQYFVEANPGFVSLTGSNALFNGTYTVTATGAAIAPGQVCTEVLVQNDPDSQGPILVGGSTAQTINLAPGQSKVYQVSNVDIVWAKFAPNTTSATLNWEAKS